MQVAIDGAPIGSGRGGDETLLRAILTGLGEVAPAEDRYLLYLPEDAGISLPESFSIRPVPRRGGARRLAVTLPARLWADRPDLVFGVAHVPLWGRTPAVLMVTDLSFLRHPEFYPPATRARLTALVAAQVRRARLVTTISEFSRRDLMDAYELSEVPVIPLAAEPPLVLKPEQRRAALARLVARGVRGPYFLYLGNLHPRKNLSRLIEAFGMAAPSGHRLVIAGQRWWGGSPEREEAARLPDGQVIFLGRVDEAEREVLLGNATALTYPSLFEGFGLPPLEAMMRGTPVLASRAGAIPEVVGEAGLLVDPLEVDEMAAAIKVLATDQELVAALRVRGVRQAAGFTIRRTGQAALAAFRSALRGA